MYVFLCDGTAQGQQTAWETFHALSESGKVKAAWAVENGLAESVMNMSFGNGIGSAADATGDIWYASAMPGAIVAELTEDCTAPCAVRLGVTTDDGIVAIGDDRVSIDELLAENEAVLEEIYPNRTPADAAPVPVLEAPAFTRTAPKTGIARPKVLVRLPAPTVNTTVPGPFCGQAWSRRSWC